MSAELGKYKPYPEYKHSRIKWIGVIPLDWEITKIRFVSKCLDGKRVPLNAEQRGKIPGDYPYWGANGVVDYVGNWIFDEDLILIGEDGAPFFEPNKDVAFNVSGKIWVNNHAHILRPKVDTVCPVFLKYALNQVDFYLYINGSTRDKLTQGDLSSIVIRLPPIDTQKNISSFLDYETARIDRLIAKQQQLIELLKEKRQAVISHVVTKGLNPDVPMKDSGVEWLGKVPENWVAMKAKNIFKFVTSGSRGWAEYYSDQGDLFFRIANLTRDTIEPKLENIQYVTPPLGQEGERSRIKENDLLISITADLGSVCIADDRIVGGYVSQHVALCRPNKRIFSSRWLAYFVLSDIAKEQLLGAGYGGTKVQLSLEDIRNLWVVVPPDENEQIKITKHIDTLIERFYRLEQNATKQILLLQERRAALISAAVTGKIDLRNWIPPVAPSDEVV